MNIHSFNRFPNTSLLKRFSDWERLKNEGVSIDNLKNEVGKIATGCPFTTLKAKELTVFRARKNENNILFKNKKDLWYPHESFVTKTGRANRIGESRMYLSQLPRTILFEMQLKQNDYVTISKLKLKNNLELNLHYLNKLETIQQSAFIEIIRNKHKGLNKNGIKNYNSVHNFICNEFMNEEDPKKNSNIYLLSTAIAEFLLSYEKIDGLLYPSIKSQNDSNIVLKKDSADEKLELIQSTCFIVRSPSKTLIEIKPIAHTSYIDENSGDLIWNMDEHTLPFEGEMERFGISKF